MNVSDESSQKQFLIPQDFLDTLFGSFSPSNNINAHNFYVLLLKNPNTVFYLTVLIKQNMHETGQYSQYLPLFISFLDKLFLDDRIGNFSSSALLHEFILPSLFDLILFSSQREQNIYNIYNLQVFLRCYIKAIIKSNSNDSFGPLYEYVYQSPNYLIILLISNSILKILPSKYIPDGFQIFIVSKVEEIFSNLNNRFLEENFSLLFTKALKALRCVLRNEPITEKFFGFFTYSFNMLNGIVEKYGKHDDQIPTQIVKMSIQIGKFISLLYQNKNDTSELNQLKIELYSCIYQILPFLTKIYKQDNKIVINFIRILNIAWYLFGSLPNFSPEIVSQFTLNIIESSCLFLSEIDEMCTNSSMFYLTAFSSEYAIYFPTRYFIKEIIEYMCESDFLELILQIVVNHFSSSDQIIFVVSVLMRYIINATKVSDAILNILYQLVSNIINIQPNSPIQEIHRLFLLSCSVPLLKENDIQIAIQQAAPLISLECENSEYDKLFFTVGCTLFVNLIRNNFIQIQDYLILAYQIINKSQFCISSDCLEVFLKMVEITDNLDQLRLIYNFTLHEFSIIAEIEDGSCDDVFFYEKRVNEICVIISKIIICDSDQQIYNDDDLNNIFQFLIYSQNGFFISNVNTLMDSFINSPKIMIYFRYYLDLISNNNQFNGESILPIINIINKQPQYFTHEIGMNILQNFFEIEKKGLLLDSENNFIPAFSLFSRLVQIIQPIPIDIFRTILSFTEKLVQNSNNESEKKFACFLTIQIVLAGILSGVPMPIEHIQQYILKIFQNGQILFEDQRYLCITVIDKILSQGQQLNEQISQIREHCLNDTTPKDPNLMDEISPFNDCFPNTPIPAMKMYFIQGFVLQPKY